MVEAAEGSGMRKKRLGSVCHLEHLTGHSKVVEEGMESEGRVLEVCKTKSEPSEEGR